MDGRWHPRLGDPTIGGWLTVAAYLVVAILCARVCFRPARLRGSSGMLSARERVCWLGVAALMAFLCINKQLDLQSFMTQVGRDIARAEGWYENRRAVQRVFVLSVAAVGGVVGLAAMWYTWRARNNWARLAAVGIVLLLTFIVVRAASFHHFEVITDTRYFGLRGNWIMELTPIMLIGWAALKSTAVR